jgi:hypothetical protein
MGMNDWQALAVRDLVHVLVKIKISLQNKGWVWWDLNVLVDLA